MDLEHEMKLRAILAEEIKERGGPEAYQATLANRWQEIDNEIPPELSAAIVAMRRAYELGRADRQNILSIGADYA